jgi:3-deoxy-D-manno-octulosonic-acid transferase
MIVLFILLTIILELVYFILAPILFVVLRNKPHYERLAIKYPKERIDILVHAASVGEVNGIKQLLKELLQINPELKILITTNTKTGRKAAESIHSSLRAILSPLDILHLRAKQLSYSKPKLILIAETEIWPTLLFCAKIHRIPVIYINARISHKSFKSYIIFKHFLRWTGSSIKAILTQTDADRIKFRALFKTTCLKSGNLKFSVVQKDYNTEVLRTEWGYQITDRIIVLGSSRPGEEELILNAYESLKQEFSELKLIIVPRHLDRMNELITILADRNYSLSSTGEKCNEIHIIDEMGLLLPAYAISNIAIIGGSFFPFGGHNPLEAAYYSKVIIMGPYYDSCVGTVKKLKHAQAIVISSIDSIIDNLIDILTKPNKYQSMGLAARQVIEDNKNSLETHLKEIHKYL